MSNGNDPKEVKAIPAQLDAIDTRNAELEKSIAELGSRIQGICAEATPPTKSEERPATNCSLEERLYQIVEGLDNRIGAVQSIIDRLQL